MEVCSLGFPIDGWILSNERYHHHLNNPFAIIPIPSTCDIEKKVKAKGRKQVICWSTWRIIFGPNSIHILSIKKQSTWWRPCNLLRLSPYQCPDSFIIEIQLTNELSFRSVYLIMRDCLIIAERSRKYDGISLHELLY